MFQVLLSVTTALALRMADPPPSPPPGETEVPAVRVAVLGDSNARVSDPDRPFDSWPEQLGRMLGPRSEVVNCSRTGTRIDPASQRFAVRMPEFRNAEDARADIVLLALGGSDFAISDGSDPAVMRAGLEAMVAALEPFRPQPRIFVCLAPPSLNAGRRGAMYLRAIEVNAPIFAQFAKEKGLGFIDLGEPFKARPPAPGEMPVPSADDSTLIAAQVFRAVTGRSPVEGSGPFRASLDLDSYDRRVLVDGGVARVPAAGWTSSGADTDVRLRSGSGGEPLMMEGAIPEGPFRMRWRLRWTRGDGIGEKGGPQVGAGGNWLWLDNRNASMMLIGPDVHGVPDLPATARVAAEGQTLELELRRSQGVLEWLVGGQVIHRTACPPKAMAQAGIRPQGARVELESWTLDLPKP